MSDYTDQINEALDDLETVDDFRVEDTDDPNVIEITIRGRLKSIIGRKKKPFDDGYDKAMKGFE